jgi:hypothetical protein
MKLSEAEISRICLRVLAVWKEKKLAEIIQPEGQVLAFMQAAIIKNLLAEEDLNKDVEVMLKKYEAQIDAGMDRRKLFNMIKTQLAKERKIVL